LRERRPQEAVALVDLRPDQPPEADLSGARYRGAPYDPAGKHLYQPLWCRRLFGTGKYQATPTELRLWSRTDRNPGRATVLALDDDLLRRWFELTVEFPRVANEPNVPRGVFFGWRLEGPGKARAYFVLLDFRPAPKDGGPHGLLVVGPAELNVGAEKPEAVTIVPLPEFQGTPPRTAPLPDPVPKYSVRVTAVPGQVRIDVNGERLMEFKPVLDPRGALGLWVQDGNGSFRTARVASIQVP
jgi:hypothetical protein